MTTNETMVNDEMQDELKAQDGQETAEGQPSQESIVLAELELVKGERDQLLDRLARLQAEFDNARKREAKERGDAREYTVSNTVEPFLGVRITFSSP